MVTSHGEPNEWGFAGESTAPQPARDTPEEREEDVAEEIAVPDTDITSDLTEALAEATDEDEATRARGAGP